MNWRLLYERIGVRNLLVAGVLAIGGVWLFLGVLEDVISGDPLVAADVEIHAASQQLRFPLLDSVMVGASEMGTPQLRFRSLSWSLPGSYGKRGCAALSTGLRPSGSPNSS